GDWEKDIRVFRNDKISILEIEKMNPDYILISPGPGTPKQAGISVNIVKKFAGKIPILGVCLGHQCIAEAYGGKVVRAKRLMHGKVSAIHNDGKTIFKGLSNPFEATRYHSLIVDEATVPDVLELSAWTKEKEIMGLRHQQYLLEGVQFHPESILSVEGKKILKNFLYLKR
ncbi:anthranilate synthase component II, partial [Elusimicrobiota bacterium]